MPEHLTLLCSVRGPPSSLTRELSGVTGAALRVALGGAVRLTPAFSRSHSRGPFGVCSRSPCRPGEPTRSHARCLLARRPGAAMLFQWVRLRSRLYTQP